MKRVLLVLLLILPLLANGQDKIKIDESDYQNQEVEMADQFRKDGKIYVALGVILVIATGLVLYMVNVDRKVSRIEKQLHNQQPNSDEN